MTISLIHTQLSTGYVSHGDWKFQFGTWTFEIGIYSLILLTIMRLEDKVIYVRLESEISNLEHANCICNVQMGLHRIVV
ncbi:hypothetical protein L2E82_19437 [Cichorium intybus]|uniref:Uncharacterized protein n=1 Tax=Cichorium intybus TaxID=13427 RepID=A0ACB9FC23_CICIN|nr:hypothetical protein L2E82_19437 [Cichorium intybus]